MHQKTRALTEAADHGLFDADWYHAQYPDVAEIGMDAYEHYTRYGYIMGRNPSAGWSTHFLRSAYGFPKASNPLARLEKLIRTNGRQPAPPATNLLRAANELALTGAHDRAIELAETYLPPELAYSAHVLKANRALRSNTGGGEASWLQHFNSYLGHFGVSPLHLQGEGPLFSRISSSPARGFTTEGPLISVIMAAYNAEKTIAQAAGSILAQSWRNLELLIVDDCSSDGTWQELQKLAAADDRVRIFRNEVNVGPYVSKNIALHMAKGVWVTGHDADDWAHPERLERQLRFLQEGGHLACLSGMVRVSPRGAFVKLNAIGRYVHDGACRDAFISLMIRRDYLKTTFGGWDHVRTSADSELLNRIETITGKSMPRIPVVTMLCLDNPEGLTNHSVYGVSARGGMSPVRKDYKANFLSWHKTLNTDNCSITLQDAQRRFPAPHEISVPAATISRLVGAYAELESCEGIQRK